MFLHAQTVTGFTLFAAVFCSSHTRKANTARRGARITAKRQHSRGTDGTEQSMGLARLRAE